MSQSVDWSFSTLSRTETSWGPHGYHRYPAKFIPQLVRQLIEDYSAHNDLVGDPFLGSATSAVEALRSGRSVLGSDISPVALLISQAKLKPLPIEPLNQVWIELNTRLNQVPKIGRAKLTEQEILFINSINIARAKGTERLNYWIPSRRQEILAEIFRQIKQIEDVSFSTFFLCGFSNILRRCSIWLSGSTKAQKDLDRTLADPIDEFRNQIKNMIARNKEYWEDFLKNGLDPNQVTNNYRLKIEDARHLSWEENSLDLIVTSPPYATCYEYSELHQLTQLWLEQYDGLEIADTRENWIGSKNVSNKNQLHPKLAEIHTGSPTADNALTKLAQVQVSNKSKQTVTQEVRALCYYFRDMHLALTQMSRTVKPGKHVILIVGDSRKRDINIPTSDALVELGQQYGLTLARKIVRKIPARVLVATRENKTGRFSSTAHSDSQAYPEENILIFKRG